MVLGRNSGSEGSPQKISPVAAPSFLLSLSLGSPGSELPIMFNSASSTSGVHMRLGMEQWNGRDGAHSTE